MAAAAANVSKAAVKELLAGQRSLAGRVVLYDGVCNLCNSGIRFIAKRDPDRNVMFCSIQSKAAEPYLKGVGLKRQDALRRLIFVEYNTWSHSSTAVIKITRYMSPPWPMCQIFLPIPVVVRDAIYDFVARYRYDWFGRTRYCQIPDPKLLDRFVDGAELVRGLSNNEGMDIESTGGDSEEKDDEESDHHKSEGPLSPRNGSSHKGEGSESKPSSESKGNRSRDGGHNHHSKEKEESSGKHISDEELKQRLRRLRKDKD